ncbi:MAG: CDP-diacylglycerol--glycerol-3-phosphate 3-phosphatidyltransferase [Candidatus Izimaplasma sp.]|nr:CDP-diacylglycerol--glycerol-3-phosphate 3-phosphatidyltransferase [Candidatus Izimaplasma bacterium]
MNLPNKLSMFRIVLVPVLLIVYYLAQVFDHSILTEFYLLGPLFIIASLTDFLDGYIARKYHLITAFGKFLDPLADKLIVLAALLILNELAIVPIWVTAVILSREFIVTGIRLVAAKDGTVIAASNLGKYKTATTMIAIILLLFSFYINQLTPIGLILMYLGTALTIISGVDYFIKNKTLLLESK